MKTIDVSADALAGPEVVEDPGAVAASRRHSPHAPPGATTINARYDFDVMPLLFWISIYLL